MYRSYSEGQFCALYCCFFLFGPPLIDILTIGLYSLTLKLRVCLVLVRSFNTSSNHLQMPLIQEIVEESFTPSDPSTPIPPREGAHYDGYATSPNCLASGLCSLVIPKDTNVTDHGELENLYTEVRFLLLPLSCPFFSISSAYR